MCIRDSSQTISKQIGISWKNPYIKRLTWDAHLSNFSRNNVSVVHLYHSPPMHYYYYWKSLYTTGFSYVIRSTYSNILKMTHQLNGEISFPFLIQNITFIFQTEHSLGKIQLFILGEIKKVN